VNHCQLFDASAEETDAIANTYQTAMAQKRASEGVIGHRDGQTSRGKNSRKKLRL
jgi:hypothetical protein